MDLENGLAFGGSVVCFAGPSAADGWYAVSVLACFIGYMAHGRGEEGRIVIEKNDATSPVSSLINSMLSG